jgi:adenosylcobinamide amidohydrolase
MSYDRDDPAVHLAELAAGLGLSGSGVGLLTGVDVADVVAEADEGVRVWATVGLGAPIQAAANVEPPVVPSSTPERQAITPERQAIPSSTFERQADPSSTPERQAVPSSTPEPQAVPSSTPERLRPGTVNVVVWVPQRLGDAALVNAVATVTEAKTQAIRELGLAATGTATDAVCVLCPAEGEAAEYGGPRSTWGARLARAAYRAVLRGGAINLAGPQSWSDRAGRS